MGFPSAKELSRVAEKLKKKEGSLALKANPSVLERFRWELHQQFVEYLYINKISQREMAALLDIDEGKVSKILRHRLDEFSTDRLIKLYEKLNPKMKLKIQK